MSVTSRRRVARGSPIAAHAPSKEMFSSWPDSAFVAGVKIGCGSMSPCLRPAGSLIPHTVWECLYSAQPLPARYPRATHSIGMMRTARHTMTRPSSEASVAASAPGIWGTSNESKWSSMNPRSRSQWNQPAEIDVSTCPLPGIGVGITTSKAEMRSEATMSTLGPSASGGNEYMSRTFPRRAPGSGRVVVCTAVGAASGIMRGENPTKGLLRVASGM